MDSNRSDPAASWLLSPLGQQATGDMKSRWLENASDVCDRINVPVIATVPELGLAIDFTNRTVSYDQYSNHMIVEMRALRHDLINVQAQVNQLTSDVQVLKSQVSNPKLVNDIKALEERRDKLLQEVSELKHKVDIEFLTSLE